MLLLVLANLVLQVLMVLFYAHCLATCAPLFTLSERARQNLYTAMLYLTMFAVGLSIVTLNLLLGRC